MGNEVLLVVPDPETVRRSAETVPASALDLKRYPNPATNQTLLELCDADEDPANEIGGGVVARTCTVGKFQMSAVATQLGFGEREGQRVTTKSVHSLADQCASSANGDLGERLQKNGAPFKRRTPRHLLHEPAVNVRTTAARPIDDGYALCFSAVALAIDIGGNPYVRDGD